MTTRYQQAAQEHLRRLDRLLDRGGVLRLRRLYNQSQAELERKIAKAIGRGSSPFTIQQYRVLLAQVQQGQMAIAKDLGEASAEATIDTQTEALRGLIAQIKKLEKMHDLPAPTLPIEEASRFAGVLDSRKTSLLTQNRASMARYGAGLVARIQDNLAASLISGSTAGEAIEGIAKTADVEFWRAERIVRTEQSWAMHATISDGIKASADAIGQMYMRWTELVSDNGKPLDDRVGADSVAMHGQVALPGAEFTMPDDASAVEIRTRYGKSRVSDTMIGKSWPHPPNRPHDRATIVPWRPSWGSPGWEVVGGEKRPVRGRE